MPIAGYESREHVLAQIQALKRERLNPYTESHAVAVDAQLALFEAELERLRAEAKNEARRRRRAEAREFGFEEL